MAALCLPNVTHLSMKTSKKFSLVLVTSPDLKTARRLAAIAINARVAACANLVPRLESHYRWRGKVEKSSEVLMIFKTTRGRLPELERLILAEHPYDTPEFVVLPLEGGSQRYLEWLTASCQ